MKIQISLSQEVFSERDRGLFGTEISTEHGRICVLTGSKYSPAKHSITEFWVDESKRGTGLGEQLLREVIRRYKSDIGGQASSAASTSLMYKCGFRCAQNIDASLAESQRMRESNSSVYMRYKPEPKEL